MANCGIGNRLSGRSKGASSAAYDAGSWIIPRAPAWHVVLSGGVGVVPRLVEAVTAEEAAASLPYRSLLGTVGSGDAEPPALGLGELVGRPSGINRFLVHSTIQSRFFTFVDCL